MAKARWVWNKNVMKFHKGRGEWLEVPPFTRIRLLKPDREQYEYIKKTQERTRKRWLVVKIEGKARYVERGSLMFEEEFNARRLRLKEEGVLPEE